MMANNTTCSDKPAIEFTKDADGNLQSDDGFLIQTVDYFAATASEDFSRSLKETGFAVLKTHPVDFTLVEEVYAEWRDFLKMLDETPELSAKYLQDGVTPDGYFPRSVAETAKGCTKKDVKHFFHCYPGGAGKYPDEVTAKAKDLWTKMTDLGRTLLEWIEKHMDPEVRKTLRKPLSEMIGLDWSLLRILHYPAYDGTEEAGAIRAGAHEDINFITVLPIGSSRGLQVWSKQNARWYWVPQEDKAIVINIGDMLQELTNGEYKSTTHRVVKPDDEVAGMDRMSTPCFIHPTKTTYLSERYPNANDYLMERLREIGNIKK